jgi:hypothetical protein
MVNNRQQTWSTIVNKHRQQSSTNMFKHRQTAWSTIINTHGKQSSKTWSTIINKHGQQSSQKHRNTSSHNMVTRSHFGSRLKILCAPANRHRCRPISLLGGNGESTMKDEDADFLNYLRFIWAPEAGPGTEAVRLVKSSDKSDQQAKEDEEEKAADDKLLEDVMCVEPFELEVELLLMAKREAFSECRPPRTCLHFVLARHHW